MTETITATEALQKIKATMEASLKMVQARTVGALPKNGSTERIATMSVSPTAKDCREAHYSISGFWDEDCLANS